MSSYRQRALNNLNKNNTSQNINGTSSYRQRALNKEKTPIKNEEVTVITPEPNTSVNFTAEDAARRLAIGAEKQTMKDSFIQQQQNKANELNNKTQNILSMQQQRILKGTDNLTDYAKTLSPEKIEEIKKSSSVLNPEFINKRPDADYYLTKFASGTAGAVENVADASVAIGSKVGVGANKVLEGILSLGGLRPNKFSEAAKEQAEYYKQLPKDVYGNDIFPTENAERRLQAKYAPNAVESVAGDVLSGVGGMLPTIATNFIAPGLGYGTLGLQGMGGGTKQAYKETGKLGAQEEIYGLLSGLAEIGVEKLSGGIGGLGKGAVDDIASKMIKNGFIRNATGEGIEEAVTTFIDPYLQRLTYNKEAEGGITNAETWKEALRSALIGSLTSMVLQGGSAAINTINTSRNTDKSVKKLNKMDSKTLNQLDEINKNLGKGITFSEVANLPEMDKATQNQLKGLENLIPQKNVAPQSATTQLKEPMQQTNRTEGETAQTGDMEQMAKNIENSNILEYNNDRGVENGEKTNSERYTSEVRDGLYQEGSEENRQYNKSEYEQWEQSLKPISRERLTTEEITDIDNTQKEYGKKVNLIDENENSNKYSGGASLIKKGQLNISRQQAEYFGLKNMIEHEVVEDDILHDDVANDILTPAIELIMNDAKFDDQKKAFWEGQTDNMPTDVLIAKDILCDRFAEIKNNTKMKYNNVLSAEVNTNIDMALQNYYKQVYGKNLNTQADTQSAFSMPETDNHGRELTKEEQEILKESKIRDSDGKLIEVYHRTNQDFDEFDKSKFGSATDDGIWGQGFYFSNRDHVDYGKNLKKGYLNITNPFVVDDFKTIEQMADYLDMSERNFHYEPDGLVRVSYNQIRQFTAHVQEKGHDGVIANHGEGLYEYVAFEPEQIVLESNNISSTPKNYINPAQDIQKASDFINKATVEDIDALNKMVEEAEKYPDRVDLQFFAEKAREAIEKLSRQQVRQAIMEETGVENYNLDDVNKISKAKMNFTTPVRVIEKIFNKETANKINENFFKPIKHNEAERIRRLNKERNDIKELDIKLGSAEDAAIQKYGEGEYVDENGLTIPYTLENLKRDFPETWQKLQNATNVIRNKYDTYLEEINEVLQDNGYDPIPKRKDYFRHFEELNDLFSILGVPTKVDDIPTDLNGITADLKPGKQFFANALQRKGKKTTYSAVKGIDGYLDGAMNILYHTKDIQKLRTLDKYIRDTYGQAKGLADANTMTEEQKAKRINQINEGHLSEFAAWLTEYTNALAGKKSRLDRGVEEMFGRKSYKYLNLMKKQVGANMTGLNLNSALSNFISVIQAGPKTSKKALLKGTAQTIKNIFTKDGFVDKSDFLTTRFGSDKLAKNWWQKAGDAGQIFMSGTDYFTANLIVRSKYQEYIDKGYTQEQAIKKADEFADRLMAGRGKGDLPTAFESKMLGIVTQFQLEVTNQLDSIFYDTLHEDYAAESTSKLAKEHPKFYNAASATFILGQLFALAFLYNEGKEELTGTEGGALDPIGTIVDAIKYLTDENLSKSEAIAKVVEDIANQLPFASIFTSGGRIPIKEAFPDLLSVAKGEAKLGDEMWNLTNLLLPTGGGQLKKTSQGLSTFAKGGSYTKDAEGNPKLKYPVEQNFENLVKSMVFGKWATEGAKDYIDRGFKSLSAKQTEGYEKAMKAGITSEEFYKAYDAQRGIKGLGDLTSPYKKTKIDEATKGLNKQQRTILYDVFDVSKTAQQSSKKVTDEQTKKQKEKLEKEKQKQKELKGFNVKFNK